MAIIRDRATLDIQELKEHLQNVHERLKRIRGHL